MARKQQLMDRNDLVTAALAAGGHRVRYFPIHVQKLCFLIDRELASHVGGPYFRFEPFHYGPFDREVYKALDALADIGRLGKDAEAELVIYCLTPAGQAAGDAILATLPPKVADCLVECARWVRVQSIRGLLTEIYVRYPDMTANSRAPDLVQLARKRRQAQSKGRAFVRGFGSILNFAPRKPKSFSGDVQDAMAADWHAVGDDLRNLMAPFPEFPRG